MSQLCLAPCDFSANGIFRAGMLEWVALSSPRGSSLAPGIKPISYASPLQVDSSSAEPF